MPDPISPPLTLVKNDWKSIGKGALIALAGCALTVATTTFTEIDFGSWTASAAAGFAILVNVLRKFLPSSGG